MAITIGTKVTNVIQIQMGRHGTSPTLKINGQKNEVCAWGLSALEIICDATLWIPQQYLWLYLHTIAM